MSKALELRDFPFSLENLSAVQRSSASRDWKAFSIIPVADTDTFCQDHIWEHLDLPPRLCIITYGLMLVQRADTGSGMESWSSRTLSICLLGEC